MTEPILDAHDVEVFDAWLAQASVWAQTRVYKARVDKAKRVVDQCLSLVPDSVCMWSGGKDSTAMTHLVSMIHPGIPVVTEKDDLDFPGERAYVERVLSMFGWNVRIISPEVSPQDWIMKHAPGLTSEDDFHSRSAALSKECFYRLVEEASRKYQAIFLGLRQEESRGRALNRACRGVLYQKSNGQYTCTPIADWRGIDVYAYLVSNGIPLLDVYRCVGFMHADEPFRIRKSWWIPGQSGRYGGVAWLRRYWPSLYYQLCEWMPDARRLT